VAGFSSAIDGMRNPMNSWEKSDTRIGCGSPLGDFEGVGLIIGEKDMDLAQRLIKAGGEHRKFLRQIHVWFDADMPRYWWSEMDTYHYNTKNSCSTIHKLLNKQNSITLDQFVYCEEDKDIVSIVIDRLNKIRQEWIDAEDNKIKERCLLRAKRLLMEGFLQLRTVDSNYEEIRNIYHQRKHHRLKEEWIDTFCKWVESLPYAKELILI
jgi:hypothetical protein